MKGALKATNGDLRKIQSVLDNMKKYLNMRDFKKLKSLNNQFHDLLVKCCGNGKLIETFVALIKQVRWATPLSLEFPGRPQQSLKEHQVIFEAFKQRKAKEVRDLLEAHSNKSMERLLSQLQKKEKQK